MSRNFSLTDLIKLTAAGMDTASFVEIRSALVNRYRSIYGSDIDLSTGSADGIFINDTALMINNILQTIKNLYSNLDVNTASGVYLDALCNLSNIRRKPATKSTASLILENSEDIVVNNGEEFLDQSGIIWTYEGSQFVLSADTKYSISVSCSEFGPIEAPAGWITTPVLLSTMTVSQEQAAEVGAYQESDYDLRDRRSRTLASDSVTVLESLTSGLLSLSGIEDVYVFNNNSAESNSALDNTLCPPHSVYVIIRQNQNMQISDEDVGTMIYTKLTPGVSTVNSSVASNGDVMSFEYTPSLLGGTTISYNQTVYWKVAKPIAPTIVIKISPKMFFDSSEVKSIFEAVSQYANKLTIGQAITVNDIISKVIDVDPTFKGYNTYSVNSANVTSLTNSLQYYNYTQFTVTNAKNEDGSYVLDDVGQITIQIQ